MTKQKPRKRYSESEALTLAMFLALIGVVFVNFAEAMITAVFSQPKTEARTDDKPAATTPQVLPDNQPVASKSNATLTIRFQIDHTQDPSGQHCNDEPI